MLNLNRSNFQAHPFHLVSPSPWPLYTSISLLSLTTSAVLSFHGFAYAEYNLMMSLISLVLAMSFWWRDVIAEGTYIGHHTLAVQRGLNLGVGLFIVSEALFFLAIFWAFFHSALSPAVELGATWPPLGIEAIDPFELPLINTVLLLASGFTVTYAHHFLINGKRGKALYGLLFTIILATIFTALQGVEYSVSSFTISDGAFGSCFYFGTGLILAPILKNIFMKIKISNYSTVKAQDKSSNTISSTSNLNPNWVTGFCDAESSFSVRIAKDERRFKSLRIAPIFTIELHEKDFDLLKQINAFFTVGTIIKRVKNGNPSVIYSVQSIKALKDVIIPHFNKYNLFTQKREDFRMFSLVVDMLYNGEHKTEEGLNKILSYKASISKGLSNSFLDMFPNIIPAARNLILPTKDFNPFWVAGFVDGEGCFYVKTSKIHSGYKVSPYFYIALHIRDIDLLENLKIYLNCGLVETVKTRPTQSSYVVYKYNEITNKIIPFFEKYSLRGIKLLDFYDFKKVVNIVGEINKYDEHSATLKEILEIKRNMNRNR
uniref:cytochrome c oxidase subunit 3 n=1 Tax=Exserohilum turcicum TaxID=93612 RepID=UPI0020007A1A|nr:cytochrome c oxidase subunit 3 [Exserohilum turcicum]UOU81407.1 cytochrome c oxidase subunit 3 [Exserohilum turcicum]